MKGFFLRSLRWALVWASMGIALFFISMNLIGIITSSPNPTWLTTAGIISVAYVSWLAIANGLLIRRKKNGYR